MAYQMLYLMIHVPKCVGTIFHYLLFSVLVRSYFFFRMTVNVLHKVEWNSIRNDIGFNF